MLQYLGINQTLYLDSSDKLMGLEEFIYNKKETENHFNSILCKKKIPKYKAIEICLYYNKLY